MIFRHLWIGPFLIIFLLMVAAAALVWGQIPDGQLIPVHWGMDGSPDGFAGKSSAFFILPKVSLFLLFIYLIIPLLEPRKENLLRSVKVYNICFLGLLMLLGLGHVSILAHALGYMFDVTTAMFIGLGAVMMAIGNYLGKVRSNFWVGIRTPWTLSSENVWNKTHRFTGWLFVLWGAAVIVSAVFHKASIELFYGIVGICVMSVIYSFWVWKLEQRS